MKVRIKQNTIEAGLSKLEKGIKGLPDAAYDEFVRNTPVRSGNARRRTSLQNDTIRANYPYAQRLDEGWSRQSPRGMVEPTVEFMKRYIKKLLRK